MTSAGCCFQTRFFTRLQRSCCPRLRESYGFTEDPESLPVSLAAIADAVDADAKAKFGWVDGLEAFGVACTGFGEALDGLLDAAGDAYIER